MKVRRDIASIPVRSATETWSAIIDLISDVTSIDKHQISNASSAMADVISEEFPHDHPIIFSGCGPQLRLYLDYATASMERGHDIDPINWNPTECENWHAHVPTDAVDLGWMNKFFEDRAPRFSAYDKEKGLENDNNTSKSNTADELEIDWSKVGEA